MGKNVAIALLIILFVLVGGYALYSRQQLEGARGEQRSILSQLQQAKEIVGKQAAQMLEMTKKKVTITLAEENKSGESGTAVLEDENGKTKVTITLNGVAPNANQPVHIHAGKCPGVGKVLYPLTDIVNGKSETTIDVSLDSLMKQLPLAINAHKSAKEITAYTACGEIPLTTFPSPTSAERGE